mmetsp:Transcript_17325/g.28699  ORF Transcript_17325/g.28699 Transcript_17325/m.28699 type:complete len:85 (+) Transcript_17325:228-482(+)
MGLLLLVPDWPDDLRSSRHISLVSHFFRKLRGLRYYDQTSSGRNDENSNPGIPYTSELLQYELVMADHPGGAHDKQRRGRVEIG